MDWLIFTVCAATALTIVTPVIFMGLMLYEWWRDR